MKTVKMTMAVVCIAVCFMAALAFSGCSHGSSDTEDAVSNPFAGTEWSGGNASLKFYSDGTVSDGKNTANGLRYRVDSDGESYTATLYIDVNGYKSDMSTLTISSAGASSGQYKLSGSSYLVTLKKSEDLVTAVLVRLVEKEAVALLAVALHRLIHLRVQSGKIILMGHCGFLNPKR